MTDLQRLAEDLQLTKKDALHIALSQGIPVLREKRGGRNVYLLDEEDAEALITLFTHDALSPSVGWFYVIVMDPCNPTQIKCGYTGNIENRLDAYRVGSPEAECLKLWACPPSEEKYALAAVRKVATRKLSKECFRVSSVTDTLDLIERHFRTRS